MGIPKTLYVTNRNDWRAWLEKNHSKAKEIWLIYYMKHTGKPRIPYDDAVEEAICLGWIDSIVRRLDDERYAQKYTPRNSGSIWSALNISRAKKMLKLKRMTQAGLRLFKEAGRKKSARARIADKVLSIPLDLKRALAANKSAADNFKKFAPCYKKTYIWWMRDAKKPQTRQRRINRVVTWAEQNKKPRMI